MPDVGLVDMAHLDYFIRFFNEFGPWSMDTQRDLTPPPAPALKNKREPISRGRKGNGGIVTSMNYKGFTVSFRPPKWMDFSLRIRTEDHQSAQYVADAVFHYVGLPPFHFPEADFCYPPLLLNTGKYLTTREECSAYVATIAKGSALRFQRKDFKDRVQRLVLRAVKSPEAVQFLNSLRESPCQVLDSDASKCVNLVLETAKSELETYSTPAVDVEEEHWKPMGFDVKEAAMLPRVKQYFCDDHDLDVSLPPSSSIEEDDKGGAILSIFSIPSLASPSTTVNSLVEVARSWRSQRKKALLLKLLPTEYDQFLYPSLKAGFTIHQVEATGMMLVQGLLTHAQPEQVEEASSDSSYNWKKRHWILDHEDVQIANSCSPSARACLSEKFDIYSYAMTYSEILTSEAKKRVHSINSIADFKPSKVDSCIAPFVRPPHVIFGQDVTIDQDLPHSIPEPGAVGTPETEQRVKHLVVADLPSSADCLEEPGDEPDSESEAMDIPTDEEVLSGESGASLKSHTEIAKANSHGPRTEASAFDEDSLFAKISPFVNQRIEEALLPLMSALQSREEDEHKHRQKMLAVEKEKLALMRQKLECTHRCNAVPANVAKLRKPLSGNFEARPSQSGTPSTGEFPRPEASLDRSLT